MSTTRSTRSSARSALQTPVRARQSSSNQSTTYSSTIRPSFTIPEDNVLHSQSSDVFDIANDGLDIDEHVHRSPMKQLDTNAASATQSIKHKTSKSKPTKLASNKPAPASTQSRVQPKRTVREKENHTINDVDHSDESSPSPSSSSSSEEDYPAVRAAAIAVKKRSAPVRKQQSKIAKRSKPTSRQEHPEISQSLQSLAEYFRHLDSEPMDVAVVHEIDALTGVPRDQWGNTSPR